MDAFADRRWLGRMTAIALAAGSVTLVSGATLASHPMVIAGNHGECDAAVKLVNRVVESNDEQTAFLAGRMLSEGICVRRDPETAALFSAHAAHLGNQSAALDYATDVGLGVSDDQSYERAGDICRKAGFDPQAQVSTYALGYACTVRGVAGASLRKTLPRGTFAPGAEAVLIEFSPGVGDMRVLAVPAVALRTTTTGSNLSHPTVDASREIQRTWQQAVSAVPKPEAARLDKQTVALSLDLDMTLEGSREPRKISDSSLSRLLRSEVQGTMIKQP
jgi:hypothetical protein